MLELNVDTFNVLLVTLSKRSGLERAGSRISPGADAKANKICIDLTSALDLGEATVAHPRLTVVWSLMIIKDLLRQSLYYYNYYRVIRKVSARMQRTYLSFVFASSRYRYWLNRMPTLPSTLYR